MEFMFKRSYCGPVKLAVFDWAGTTVDYGCMAPAGAFVELFRRHGVEATIAQARGPMGMHKRDHIATMLSEPALAKLWQDKHGAAHTKDDIEALFQEFIPMQIEALPPYAKLIPGVAEVGEELRARGIKLGGTTGYNEEMMHICMEGAKAAGYAPDISIAGSMVPAGRPAPWMAVRCALELNVFPFESIVKIGDTVTDIQEGLNAGMWTIGITKTGNEVGLSQEEAEALPAAELEVLIRKAEAKLFEAGAHYVADGVADILPIIDEIGLRLSQGERP
ncbi:MAG: phosphonoacetaldehyde hydrolase [Candidatus Hydrogenedens sp.]|nr:phosphonoacetaldehyde hydrolase [Candidatus Hydrogenedens sp.]